MTQVLYRDFEIIFSPPPIPVRWFDWSYAHLDYDGPEDRRIGHAPSLEDAKHLIDEWWEEHEPVEVEQFDETVADDFNMDFSEVVL